MAEKDKGNFMFAATHHKLLQPALLSLLLAMAAGTASAATSTALDPAKERQLINDANKLDADHPEDAAAVRLVCTACHSATQYLNTPRSAGRWEQVFAEMSGYGASPTDDQIDQIVRYFERNLTVVDINSSPAEEIAPVLQVSDAVANDIVARRQKQKFAGIDDLAKVPGVDAAKLAILKPRLMF
jgi:hypothetical protein